MTINTSNQIQNLPVTQTEMVLRTWYLVCDCSHQVEKLEESFHDKLSISESLLPQIKTVATMIAAQRHCFDTQAVSPAQFTEEADWFAARILVLKAAVFHLDVTLHDMLKTANQRAERFAKQFGLSFAPAQAKLSLHAGRPQAMLIIETPLGADESVQNVNIIRNTQKLARMLPAKMF